MTPMVTLMVLCGGVVDDEALDNTPEDISTATPSEVYYTLIDVKRH